MATKVTDLTAVSQSFIDSDYLLVSKHVTQTSGVLIVGEEYTILDFNAGDDFANIATVVSGVINTTGCVFTATGTTPTTYTNGSTLAYYISQKASVPQIGGLPKVYKALLTQSLSQQTSGVLIVGHSYKILVWGAGDDFTNVGAASNVSGTIFTATGTTPTNYTNSSVLIDNTLSAPVATVLVNTLSGTPTFSYISAGNYRMTLTGEFTANKTITPQGKFIQGTDLTAGYDVGYSTVDYIEIKSLVVSGAVLTDDLLSGTPITIEVYP